VEIGRYNTSAFTNWTGLSMLLPVGAQNPQTLFRWRQLANSGSTSDHWALDDVTIQTAPTPPEILVHPTNQVVSLGDSPILIALAAGPEPMAYQWQHNGTNLPGATITSLILTNVQRFSLFFNNYASVNSSAVKFTGKETENVDPS
jgi:hypothetical protein